MKRFFSVLLSLVLLLTNVGCEGSLFEEGNSEIENIISEETQASDEVAEISETNDEGGGSVMSETQNEAEKIDTIKIAIKIGSSGVMVGKKCHQP